MGSLNSKEFAWVVAFEVELHRKFWRPNGQGYSVARNDITKSFRIAQGYQNIFSNYLVEKSIGTDFNTYILAILIS